MLEHKIIKALLDKECYKANRKYLTAISDGMKPWLATLDWWHLNHDSSISPEDFFNLHVEKFNPVATKNHIDLLASTFNLIKEADVNPTFISALLEEKFRQDKYALWAERLVQLSEGDSEISFDEMAKDISNFKPSNIKNEFPPIVLTSDELISGVEKQAKWKFHLPVLRNKVSGVGEGVFALVAARPEAGKSLFMVSCCFHPGGWADQGAKIVYLGNEESLERTILRAVMCHSGMTTEEMLADKQRYQRAYDEFWNKFKDRVIFYHETGMDYSKIPNLIEEHRPDILIIDQLDKLSVKGVNDKLSEMDIIYTNMREYSVKYNIVIFGVSQASDLATNRRIFGYECLEHSRTRKAAELDLCICIGAENLIEDNNVRYINIAKNKLGTNGGNTCTYMINKLMSRMEV